MVTEFYITWHVGPGLKQQNIENRNIKNLKIS